MLSRIVMGRARLLPLSMRFCGGKLPVRAIASQAPQDLAYITEWTQRLCISPSDFATRSNVMVFFHSLQTHLSQDDACLFLAILGMLADDRSKLPLHRPALWLDPATRACFERLAAAVKMESAHDFCIAIYLLHHQFPKMRPRSYPIRPSTLLSKEHELSLLKKLQSTYLENKARPDLRAAMASAVLAVSIQYASMFAGTTYCAAGSKVAVELLNGCVRLSDSKL